MKKSSIFMLLLMSKEAVSFSLFTSKQVDLFEAVKTNNLTECKRYFTTHGTIATILDNSGRTPLHLACDKGYTEVCKLLLEKGAQIEAQDKEGRTPLHMASIFGRLDICRILVEKGAQIEVKDDEGRTPLCMACSCGYVEIFKLLLGQGAKVQVADMKAVTPLHAVCQRGSTELCSLLLEKGSQTEVQDVTGRTPLHYASKHGHVEICRLLLGKGAKTELLDKEGRTALHEACYFDRVELCKLLLERGVKIDTQDNKGTTAFHVACGRGSGEVCKLLLKKGARMEIQDKEGRTALHEACSEAQIEVCKFLLEKGAKTEVQNVMGWTPLHIACKSTDGYSVFDIGDRSKAALRRKNYYASLCTLLLEKGSDINARTHARETPLMIACKEGQKEVVHVLLSNKRLKKELKDDLLEGTALHWACSYNHLELCTELLRAGFSADETANTLSLLHLAVKTGNLQLVELFLENQSDSNKADKNGATALHLSCELGFDSITEELLIKKNQSGIKINAESLTKKTPLHSAVEADQVGSVRLLLKYGALPNEVDSYNKTPLMFAAEKKNLAICRLIKDKLSVSQFNEMKKFLGSLVRGHRELENLFGVYSELSLTSHSGNVSLDDNREVQGSMSRQNLPNIRVNNSSTYEPEKIFSDNVNEDIVDQVSDGEEVIE